MSMAYQPQIEAADLDALPRLKGGITTFLSAARIRERRVGSFFLFGSFITSPLTQSEFNDVEVVAGTKAAFSELDSIHRSPLGLSTMRGRSGRRALLAYGQGGRGASFATAARPPHRVGG